MEPEVKNMLASKTFWVNILTVIAILVNRKSVVFDPLLIEPLAILLLPLVNIGLRYITKHEVKLWGSK